MRFNNLEEVFDYLDQINDADSMDYDLCKLHSFENIDWYEAILKEVLKLPKKPKRVIDVGSNLNQYGFLFANEGIEYIGIDNSTMLPDEYGLMQPLITDKIKFIQADYRDAKICFKDDIIISCLCVGYLIDYDEVDCDTLIVNDLKDGMPIAKVIKKKEDD